MNNEEKDAFIHDHIIVDCYDEYEQKLGWYHYLMEELDFPFTAYLRVESIDQKPNVIHSVRIEVIGFDGESTIDRCYDFIVRAKYQEYIMKFFLLDISDVRGSDKVKASIDLWKYWSKNQ